MINSEILPAGGLPRARDLGGQPTPWWVVVGLAMAPAVALGLARFAYALLLPPMREELGWSFAEAGAMNAANAAGYLTGALVAAPLGRRLGDRVVLAGGLLVTTLSIAASGLMSAFALLLVLRTIAGLAGALAFVAGAGLATAAAAGGSSSRAPTVLGLYFAGAGLGVAASALAVPPLLPELGWRAGWLALGGLSIVASAYAWLALRRVPEPARAASAVPGRWSPATMAWTLFSYGLFGAGYIAYATFIVAYLQGELGFGGGAVAVFWSVLGLASVVAAFAWGPLLGRLKGGWGTAATVGTVIVGAVLPLVWTTPGGAYLSAALFGGSFLAVIAAVGSFARRTMPPHAWTAAIGTLTVAFGIGQCVGPVLSGVLSDGAEGIRAGLWPSVGILALSAAAATLQSEPGRGSAA